MSEKASAWTARVPWLRAFYCPVCRAVIEAWTPKPDDHTTWPMCGVGDGVVHPPGRHAAGRCYPVKP